jgi:hypothetical protein
MEELFTQKQNSANLKSGFRTSLPRPPRPQMLENVWQVCCLLSLFYPAKAVIKYDFAYFLPFSTILTHGLFCLKKIKISFVIQHTRGSCSTITSSTFQSGIFILLLRFYVPKKHSSEYFFISLCKIFFFYKLFQQFKI